MSGEEKDDLGIVAEHEFICVPCPNCEDQFYVSDGCLQCGYIPGDKLENEGLL